MSTIVTRSGKGSPLTNNEVDANFTNLNTDKIQVTGTPTTGQAVIWNGSAWVPGASATYPGAGIANSTGSAWGTSYGTSGANSVVLRDANQNIVANSISETYSNVAAAGTTTVLTVASGPNYVVTGSGGQTYQLPDATTLPNGINYTFNNNQSSGTIIVKNNSSTTVATIQSGGYVDVILLSNATAAGSWDVHAFTPSNVSWSTNTFDYAGSITSATWNGATVAVNRGGTGATTAQGAINTFAGAVTSGSYLRGNGTNVVMSTIQAADVPTLNQNTTGTAANVTGTVAIANGGTGQTTANAAFNALIPAQGSNSGKFLTTDGSNTSWATVTAGVSQIVAGTNVTLSPTGGTGVVTINAASATASYVRTAFTATSGQTSFTVAYTVGYAEVFLNGVLLNSTDYTASSGTAIVLASGALVGDIVEVIAYNTVAIGSLTSTGVLGGTSGQLLTSNGTNSYWANAPVTLPSQSGLGGKFLKTDGSNASWSALPSNLPVLNYSGSTISVSVANGSLPVLNYSGSTINVTVS